MEISNQKETYSTVSEEQVENDEPLDVSKTNREYFNTKGVQRKRAPKKYRKDMTDEEWDNYQRIKSTERSRKYRKNNQS